MDSNTSVAIMFISAFSATAIIVSFLLNYRLKSKLIRLGILDTDALKIIGQMESTNKREILKWISLLLFGGLGLVVLQFTGYNLSEPLPYGVEAIFMAAGLLVYFLLAYRKASIQ